MTVTVARLLPVVILCLCLPAFIAGAAEKDSNVPDEGIARTLRVLEGVYPASPQVVIVTRAEAPGPDAQLYAYEMNDEDEWKHVLGPVPAMIGRNGFAPPGEKREGDGRTPAGTYYLGFAFGYLPKVDSAMPYRRMTKNDIWVDDPASPDYNRPKKRGETQAKSFEDMVLPDDRYKYGIVIRYNMDPVVPGHGSAIFLHVWKDPKTPTSGCVAVSEENMLKLLKWLDPGKRPVIMLEKP